MLRLIVGRVAQSALLLLIVTAFSFVLLSLLPGTIATTLLGVLATQEQIDALNAELGLDQPVWLQYANWLGGVLRGDLGSSLANGTSVAENLNGRLVVTLSLVVTSILVTVIIGLALGVFTAVRRGPIARVVDVLAVVGLAIPSFWLAQILILAFSVQLAWLPSLGFIDLGQSLRGWATNLVLPVTALAVGMITAVAKQTRQAMLQTLASPYVVGLEAAGISRWRVIYKHALRNAAIPILTVTGLLFVGSLTGAVLIEQIFVLPGLGSAVVSAAANRDIPTIQGIALYMTLIVIVVNIVIDLAYGALNPKVRAR